MQLERGETEGWPLAVVISSPPPYVIGGEHEIEVGQEEEEKPTIGASLSLSLSLSLVPGTSEFFLIKGALPDSLHKALLWKSRAGFNSFTLFSLNTCERNNILAIFSFAKKWEIETFLRRGEGILIRV